ncbi:MAG: site-specific DNA-methyltransferase [Thermoplasmata archaeon]
MFNQITQGDCLELLPNIGDEVVNLVLTSPPYDDLRDYNGFSFNFSSISRELYRVLCPGGCLVWVVADATKNGTETGTSLKQALSFMELGFNLHDTMIYQKARYVPLTHRRYEQAWEYIFCFSKGKPNSFNPIRIPCLKSGVRPRGTFQHTSNGVNTKCHKDSPVADYKIAPNIFTYVSQSIKGHPAPFPLQLAIDQISTWTDPCDIVLDPFAGSGTSCLAAKQLGRYFIGLEISEDYCKIARSRLV